MGNGPVAADELRLLIERVERLEEEKKGIADDIKDVYGEAKSRGFCAKTMRKIVSERKKTSDQRREEQAMLDIYRGALGMLDGTPLGNWAVEKLSRPKKPAAEPDEGTPPAPADAATAQPEASEPEAPAEPPVSIEEARQQGGEAARSGKPVTANPFPPRSPHRAAWDEAWCRELGSDGMEIPEALRPAGKAKPKDEAEPAPEPAPAPEAEETPAPVAAGDAGERGAADPVYADARAGVIASQYASTSRIQKTFAIGYNRAAAIIEALEAEGVVGAPDATGKRAVLVDTEGRRK